MRTKMLIAFLLLVPIIVLLFSCGSHNKKSEIDISYSKAKGRSIDKPHFVIKLKGDSVYYNGIANMPTLGEHNFKISKSELKKITDAFEQSNFLNFDALYQSNIRDLPMSIITYNNHEVKYQERQAPEELKKLASLLEELVENQNY